MAEHAVPCGYAQVLSERLDGLERWQQQQNGTLRSLEAKVDKLLWWIVGLLVAQLGTLVALMLSHTLLP